ncbi:MAG: GAF domain-containing protein [Hahellaceae bacterium]|nr:GAF domain-containing protein [Hahellaceae bacterium]
MHARNEDEKSIDELRWEVRKLRQQLALQDAAKAEEIDLIGQILQTANATLDLDEVVAKVMDALGKVFEFDQLSIFLFNAKTNCLEPTNWYGAGFSETIKQRFEAFPLSIDWDDVYFIKAFLDNEPFCISPITSKLLQYYSPRDRQMFEWNPHTAIACFPLQVLDKVIGIINFVHTQKPITLTNEQTTRIQRYTGQIATTINHAYLIRKAQFALKETQAREREIRHINQIIQAANTHLDFDAVFKAILEGLRDVFEFDALGIQLSETQDEQLNIFRVYGDFITESQLARYRAIPIKASGSASVTTYVFKTGEPAYFPHVTPDLPFSETDRAIYDVIPFVSYLAYPLKVLKNTIGVISFFCRTETPVLDEAKLARIQRYVLSLSTAVYNAKSHEELKQSQASFRFLAELASELQLQPDTLSVLQTAIARLSARFPNLGLGLMVTAQTPERVVFKASAGLSNDEYNLLITLTEHGMASAEAIQSGSVPWWHFSNGWTSDHRCSHLFVKSTSLTESLRTVISLFLDQVTPIAENKFLASERNTRSPR